MKLFSYHIKTRRSWEIRKKTIALLIAITVLAVCLEAAADSKESGLSEMLPAFSAPGKGYSLYIDLDICKMTVYKDGKAYKAFPVSGGKPSTPSPLGPWKIAGIYSWGKWYGGCFMRLNVPWGIYGIHGTVTPHVIGKYNASGGCIRMHNSDVHELKKLISPGTAVYIKQKTAAFRILENGMIGSDVYIIQQMLQAMGYYKGSLDGKFGKGLENAVIEFQKGNNIKPDGIVGYETYNRIRNSLE